MALYTIPASSNGRLVGWPAGTWASIWGGTQGKVYGPTETNPDNLSAPMTTKTVSDWLFRSYMDFDLTPYTAADFDEVTEANIYVYIPGAGVANPNTQGITAANAVNITKGVWTNLPPQYPADWTPQNTETTIQGSLTSTPSLGGYAAIPFNSTGLTWLGTMAGQNLKICLRFTRDIDNNPWLPPATAVMWHYLTQESGKGPYIEFTGYSSNRIYVFLGDYDDPTKYELTDPDDAKVFAARTERGWDEELQQASTGIAEITCDNHLGDFSPENTGGAYYGDLALGKYITVYEKYNGTIYRHFKGRITKITPHAEWDNQVAYILAADGMDDLAELEINTQLRTNTDTGTLIGDILDAAGWPAGDRDIDSGIDTLNLGWFHKIKALVAIRILENIELGRFHITPTGDARWENRHARLAGDGLVSQHDFEDTAVELPYEWSKSQVKNRVLVRGRRYFIGGVQLFSGYDMGEIDDELIWSAQSGDTGAPLISKSGSLELWAEFNVPLESYDSLVKGTHWNANTEPDKTGDDVSDNITLTQTQYGQSIRLLFENSGDQDAYLVEPDSPPAGAPSDRTALVYGVLYSLEPMAILKEDTTSQDDYGKRGLELDVPFKSNPNDVEAQASFLLSKYKDAVPRAISVRHTARTAWPDDTIRVQCLVRDISDRITLKSTLLGIDQDYYINKVIQDYVFLEAGIVHETTWIIERALGTAEGVWWLLGVTDFGELGETAKLGF